MKNTIPDLKRKVLATSLSLLYLTSIREIGKSNNVSSKKRSLLKCILKP